MSRKKANLPEFRRAQIITLREEGYSFRDIAKKVKCGKSTVQELCKKFELTGEVKDKPRTGRPTKSTPRQDRVLVRLSQNSRFSSSKELAQQWRTEQGVNVSASTVRTRLIKAGLNARRPVKKPLLSDVNIKKRYQWAQAHAHWTDQDWAKVLFSDESPFELVVPHKKCFVRRRKGERYNKECVLPTVEHGGGSLMVWGCISDAGVGLIQRVHGNINSEAYIQILKDSMVPSAGAAFGQDFVFQQDNAPCHTSKMTTNYLLCNRINVLPWPPQSPDMNPIEHMWDELERRLYKQEKATSLDDLYLKLQSVWYDIPIEVVRNLISSMPRRVEALLKARGGITKY